MIIFRLLANGLAPLTLLGAVSAYFFPELFLPIKHGFMWMFAATMFALGIVLKPADLNETLKRPKAIGLGVLTQFSIMPLLGFAAAWFSDLPPALALGFIIVGCAPGAMASNVIVYLAGGAVAFSIALTTVATFLSPMLTPLLVKLLGNAYLEIPFWPMMLTILQTVLFPLLLGMGLRRLLGNKLALAKEIAPAVASLAIILICSYAVAANQARISTVGMDIFALVVLVNLLGYLAGWQAARLFRFDNRHQLTLAIEIGMQNAGLGVVLAMKHFSAETALPGALFAVWCILTSAGASAWLRRHHEHQTRLDP
ncbi:MAG: bile acid:sodium symporter family protein [Gammaproteobacteria bacterium]|nr:bile acid:sodium symporter family protein [Gammaproteobacteria bacterium]